ncbi:MAG: carbamate kinase [Bradyrhizobiaceae bacterium]|nr:carbamate kinase [Bradyrhizobiaceae bacterium]
MLVVLALGGNALVRRGEPAEEATQRRNARAAAAAVAEIAREHRVVITHGNGPQVGLLALQSAAYTDVRPYAFDMLGAESAGMISYLLEEALAAELPGRETATLLTLVEVSPNDPAFADPKKPIGPVYDEKESRALAARTSWHFMKDGAGFRRAIASPMPQRIRGLAAVESLVRAGVVLICVGGGGIPVVVQADGSVRGVEAVIDKDFTSAMLAEAIGADALLLLTDVEGVFTDWPHAKGPPLRKATPALLRGHQFAPGSMAPKVEAACRFVERTGRRAMIGAIKNMSKVLKETAGTIVLAD